MRALVSFMVAALIFCSGAESRAQEQGDPGLLFHVSAERGVSADVSGGGTPEPTFVRDVEVIADGARGKGLECAGTQLLAYRAPGNIYAQRGTLAFYWRSRDPVGPTPFPVFRVAYADHSSWDMVWLRIDYNGRRGFDAFVTDVNLSRVRVSTALPKFPAPSQWVHLAFAWDETRGVRLYVDGKKVAVKEQAAVLDAGLDQLGPHSRVINPMQVQSDYNFIRGGDIDEIRIYDRMLADASIADLAAGRALSAPASKERSLSDRRQRDAWYMRHGWNRPLDPPPHLAAPATRVRKVEIHDVFDLKRWWWKGTDGIRETTWPGVYNRSRLPGRNDYFQLPDWDCYSLSGKAVTFTLPAEPWNHIEISGAAWGAFYAAEAKTALFRRARGQEKTVHRLSEARVGQTLRFESAEQEQPIGELSALYVAEGAEPASAVTLSYTVRNDSTAVARAPGLAWLAKFIEGRHPAEERTLLLAAPDGAQPSPTAGAAPAQASSATTTEARSPPTQTLPIFHVLVPSERWDSAEGGLDGIALDLPALQVTPTHGAYFPLQVEVKDPLWPARNLIEFSFSVKPGEARTLWLDTRNRMLPAGKALYVTLSGAGADLSAEQLEGVRLRLRFVPRAEAVSEHELDRFTQARDAYAMLSEERPRDPRFDLYNRFAGDIQDLLRVSPKHWLGQTYWYDSDNSHPKPAWKSTPPPAGVPLWAHRQVELLGALERLVLWYIDHRQIENGEFGGGLSDDGDLTNLWPGAALMGAAPDKIEQSLARELEAYYAQGLMTNGLSTIQTDELHAYEEGIAVLGQLMLLDYGNPKLVERAMETARALRTLSGINGAGHRHMRSSYFSGTRLAEEEPWGGSREYSYLLTQVVLLLVDYNGIPEAKRLVIELADGLLAHHKAEGERFRLRPSVRFVTDEDAVTRPETVYPLLWAAFRFSGDAKYLAPLRDEGPRSLELIPTPAPRELGVSVSARDFRRDAGVQMGDARLHLAWEATGDVRYLENLYGAQTEAAALREYINTQGSLWIDRIGIPSRESEPHRLNGGRELQRARLGGVALIRNWYFPGHAVSWKFHAPASAQSVALLTPSASPRNLKILGHNLTQTAVTASMTTWNLEPGRWEMKVGPTPDGATASNVRTLYVERGGSIEVTFPPRVSTVLELKQLEAGPPAWTRPDLAIGAGDVVVTGQNVRVTVHNIGGAEAPASEISVIDSDGRVRSTRSLPALAAPHDLLPKTRSVSLPVRGPRRGLSVVLDPGERLDEISELNNRVEL